MTGFDGALGFGSIGDWDRNSTSSDSSGVGKGEIYILEQKIEKLLMLNEALWTFIKEKHGYIDEDLIKRIAEIDMKDGRLDGRVAPEESEALECPKCGRKVGKHRPTCRYCGEPIVHSPFER